MKDTNLVTFYLLNFIKYLQYSNENNLHRPVTCWLNLCVRSFKDGRQQYHVVTILLVQSKAYRVANSLPKYY